MIKISLFDKVEYIANVIGFVLFAWVIRKRSFSLDVNIVYKNLL